MSAATTMSVGTAATLTKRPGFRGWTIPISLFSIPLGLAGLGRAWAAATRVLGASDVPACIAYAASTFVWAGFTVI
jgi:tellurite resistance protein